MNGLPNELIQHILSFLSQRYVAVASLVCKEWLIATRHKQFYQIIYIYSAKQLKKFLNIVTTLKITKNNIPVGQLVCKLYIDKKFHQGFIRYSDDELNGLYISCPNLTKIVGLYKYSIIREQLKYVQSWPCLTIVPLWYSYRNETLLHHKQHRIIRSLKYDIRQNNTKNDIIQLQMDRQEIYRPISVHANIRSVNNERRKSYYELDERVFSIVNSTCSQLESFTLYHFFMNLSDDYLYNLTTTNKFIQPHSSLKQLHFNPSAFNDVKYFDYLSKLYPNVTDLKLHIIWAQDDTRECKQYKLSIINMIASFTCLKKLSADLTSNMDNIWPSIELYEWLIDNPTQLDVLDLPYDLLNIKNCYLTHLHSKLSAPPPTTATIITSTLRSSSLLNQQKHNLNCTLTYLHHLTTLTLHLLADATSLLQYLQMNDYSTNVSLSITSLTIIGRFNLEHMKYNDNEFFIHQWLDALSHLKKLDLIDAGNIKKEKRNREKDDTHQYEEQQHRSTYSLKELNINNATIHLSNDQFQTLLSSCPSLRILTLERIVFMHSTPIPTLPSFLPPIKNINNSKDRYDYILIDMPHLHLDKLDLIYFRTEELSENSLCE
ncbi:unnamed protein product [Cunninghamella echinulata]